MSTRILLRKLSFLSKLLSSTADTLSTRIFTTFSMNDIYSLSIVQQCRMLKAPLATDVVNQCLSDPPNARSIVKSSKEVILQCDYNLLLSSSSTHPTAQYVSQIASHVSWRKIWDNALDHGMKGTEYCQAVLRELSRPTFGDRICHLCKDSIITSSFALHICDNHTSLILNESLPSIVSKVSSLDMNFILTIGAKLHCSR